MTTMKKAKSGKSFPDLNKDGKVTRADILKGRGVIAKKGATIKKAKTGTIIPKKNSVSKNVGNLNKAKSGGSMKNKGPKKAVLGALLPLAMKALPMVAGMLASKKKKNGGSMKKCKYGCK